MVRFGQRRLGLGQPCFIVFEAGATHDGKASAKKLISLAASAGADAVKFQIFNPDLLVSDKKQQFSYDILIDKSSMKTETVQESLYDILSRRSLNQRDWVEIKEYSDSMGLAFFATIGFEEDIELLESFGCDSIKIASADINHWPLIRKAAKTGLCIQLDTGNADLGEIENAVEICLQEGNDQIIIHNCPSGYPARLKTINLRLIPTLKQMYPQFPIAYSDHTPGWDMDVAALAIGADLIEKTITLDRTIKSPEHMFSLEPDQMKSFISTIREVEIGMGQPRSQLTSEEKDQRLKIRRSTFFKKDMKKGMSVFLSDVEFRRPGFGMSPDVFESVEGKLLLNNAKKGQMLMPGDIE